MRASGFTNNTPTWFERIPVEIRILFCFLCGVTLLSVAGVTLYFFAQSTWVTDPGSTASPSYPSDWTGYNVNQFVALVFFTFCAPSGTVLVLTAMQHSLRASKMSVIGPVSLLFIAWLAAGAVIGAQAATDPLLTCFYVGCTGTSFPRHDPSYGGEAGHGWLAVVGTSVFFMNIWLILTVLGSVAVSIKRLASARHSRDEENPLLGQQMAIDGYHKIQPHVLYRDNYLHDWLWYILYFLVIFFYFFFATTTIPNSWEYFQADRIASYAALQTAHDYDRCYYNFSLYTCPEYPDAVFFTTTVKVNQYWYLKFFPSNVIFFSFLLVFPTLAMVLRHSPRAKAVLRRTLFRGNYISFSYGEFAVLGCFAFVLLLWCIYWFNDHDYNGYWPGPQDTKNKAFYAEKVARGFGQVAIFFFSFLIFPAARTSVFHTIFDVSWELAIKYHRLLGYFFLLASFAHMVTTYAWYYYTGNLPTDIFDVPMHLATSIDNFTVPLISLVYWCCIILFMLAAVEQVRRKMFEVFYYAHILGFIILTPAVLWHAAAGWEYLLPSLTIWFFDRCYRMFRSSQRIMNVRVKAMKCGAAGDITEIVCDSPFGYYSGQYCFLNVAEISLFEWHPFTISSSDPRTMSFHIKDMGPGTFTGKLHQAVSRGHNITVCVDGPYGKPINFYKYKTIILVAGGIGITPVKSIFESLVANHASMPNLRSVHLCWVARDSKLFALMQPAILSAPRNNFFMHFFSVLPRCQGHYGG
eukprot:PhF_6_TR21146/c0_g1_i1/m.30424/K00521/E1.16.1.7; ferric-chelate reductase